MANKKSRLASERQGTFSQSAGGVELDTGRRACGRCWLCFNVCPSQFETGKMQACDNLSYPLPDGRVLSCRNLRRLYRCPHCGQLKGVTVFLTPLNGLFNLPGDGAQFVHRPFVLPVLDPAGVLPLKGVTKHDALCRLAAVGNPDNSRPVKTTGQGCRFWGFTQNRVKALEPLEAVLFCSGCARLPGRSGAGGVPGPGGSNFGLAFLIRCRR